MAYLSDDAITDETACSIRPDARGCEGVRKRAERRRLGLIATGLAALYAWQAGYLKV